MTLYEREWMAGSGIHPPRGILRPGPVPPKSEGGRAHNTEVLSICCFCISSASNGDYQYLDCDNEYQYVIGVFENIIESENV